MNQRRTYGRSRPWRWVLGFLFSVAVLIVWANDRAQAQTCHFLIDEWESCVDLYSDNLAGSFSMAASGRPAWEEAACRDLYLHPQGAFYAQATAFVNDYIVWLERHFTDADGNQFLGGSAGAPVWEFDTESERHAVNWQWPDPALLALLQQSLDDTEDYHQQLINQGLGFTGLDDVIEVQKNMLTLTGYLQAGRPLFTADLDNMPFWATSPDQTTHGFWQLGNYTPGGPTVLTPNPDDLVSLAFGDYGIMDPPASRWNPTMPLGIETLECEGRAHVSFTKYRDETNAYCANLNGWNLQSLVGTICTYWRTVYITTYYWHNCGPGHAGAHCPPGSTMSHQHSQSTPTRRTTIRNVVCPTGWISQGGLRCRLTEGTGSIIGTGGTEYDSSDLATTIPPPSGVLGKDDRIGEAARWFRRGPDQVVPDPTFLTFSPSVNVQPRADSVLVGIPAYISLNNVPSSCQPGEAPGPVSTPGIYDWTGCVSQVVSGTETNHQISWPTRSNPMIDTVSRESGNRHRAVAAEKMNIVAVDSGRGLRQEHECWTEATDIATAEAALGRGWPGNHGVAAPGLRFLESRPVDPGNPKDSAVYPQPEECAMIFEAPGTYTVTVTIHWIGAQWHTSWITGDTTPDPLPWDSNLLSGSDTTSVTLQVGVCELHTIPTDRLPSGTPSAGQARSCIDGDNH